MGCNQSTNNDIKESRQRAPPGSPRGQNKTGGIATQSPSQNINSRYSEQASDGMLLGTSYTDERTGQADFFKDIIQRTAESFIDVGQSNVAPLDRKEAGDRAKEYSGTVGGAGKFAEAVFPLPTPSKQNESPMAALSATPVITPADHEALENLVRDLGAVVADIRVHDVGKPLVASLPEI